MIDAETSVRYPRRATVLISAYNAANFLAEAIESVSAQDFDGDIECIVIDDGSTDATPEIATSYQGVILLQQENKGQSHAHNTGLARATGDVVIFLDHDDIMLPWNLSTNAELLASLPDTLVVAGRSRSFRQENGRPEVGSPDTGGPLPLRMRSYADILKGHAFVPPTVLMFRTDFLRSIGGYHHYPSAHDLDLYLRSAAEKPILTHEREIVLYRRHSENHSSDISRMLGATLDVLEDHRVRIGDDETLQIALETGIRHWCRLFGPLLPWEVLWSLKEGRLRRALAALKLYGRIRRKGLMA